MGSKWGQPLTPEQASSRACLLPKPTPQDTRHILRSSNKILSTRQPTKRQRPDDTLATGRAAKRPRTDTAITAQADGEKLDSVSMTMSEGPGPSLQSRAGRRRKRFHATHAAFLRRLKRLSVVQEASALYTVSDADVPLGSYYPRAIPVYQAKLAGHAHPVIIKVVGKGWGADMEVEAHTTLSKVTGSCVVPLVCPPLQLSCKRQALAMRRVEVGFGRLKNAGDLLKRVMELFVALTVWHRLCWLHCDLKPSNLGIDNESGKLCLFDLGLSMKIPSESSVVDMGGDVGTAPFMAPEAVHGSVSTASDVYSACATVVHIMRFRSSETCLADFAPEHLQQLRALMAQGLVKNRNDRPSACKMVESLKAVVKAQS